MSTLRCREAFMAYDRETGEQRLITTGALVLSTDKWVKGRESHFDKVEDYVETWGRRERVTQGDVEQATAAPGEQRSVVPKPDPEEDKPARRPYQRVQVKDEKSKKDGEV